MVRVKNFLKREAVLCVAFILALISCFFVKPDSEYFSYIDYRTLGILLALMLTMAGLQKLSVFRQIGEVLVNKIGDVVILVPKTAKWDSFMRAADMFSPDFMIEDRGVQYLQEREEL